MGHMTVKNIPFFFFIVFFIFYACRNGESRPQFACDPNNPITKKLPFCDESVDVSDRVKDLIGRLTLQEKVKLLVDTAAPVDRLGIKGYGWWSEALHGVSDVGRGATKFGGEFPGATSFPQVITMAASFNASLWERIGQVVSDEARAMYNGGKGGLTYWSPNVNILRDPRWGRCQETPGEDPALVSKYAVSYVRGLQANIDPRNNKLKVAATCKHFTAYDLDKWNRIDRFHFDAKVSKQDLEDTYNVPFKACVVEGKVASVMCSYNEVNGKPTCADQSLLRDTIRGQWHLNGYIVCDCDSVSVMFKSQHYTATPEEAAAVSIKAGLDLDCGSSLGLYTEQAIRIGKLTEADVNGALENTFTVQMRLGMFDGPNQPYDNLGPKDVCTPAHQQLALEAAQQGIVLLQNNGHSLPLSTSRHKTVAVIGPNSDVTVTMIGNYAGVPCGYTTPLQGITKYVKTIHEPGCDGVACNGRQLFEAAKVAAQQADATVLVVGLNQSIEAEGKDRVSLLLPGNQQELVSEIAMASKGPTILVLMSGGPIDVTFAKTDPKISAIVWAGYPGQAGGAAIADVIFGNTNPSGKLPMTWYPQDYVTKVPMTNMNMRADPSTGYPGRTYRFYKGPVVFPFGFGLSYTSFKQTLALAPTNLSIPLSTLQALKNTTMTNNAIRTKHTNCDTLNNLDFHIDVKNEGDIDGTHTLLVYSTPPASDNKWGYEKQLIAFAKVHVVSGDKQRVMIKVDVCKHLSVVDQFGIRRIPMGDHSLHIGDLKHSISLQAAFENIKV